MSEYKRKTEKTHEIDLPSKICFCHWRKHSALIGTEVYFDISTEFVADGTEITIWAKDTYNKVRDTITDVITANELKGKYIIPENAEDNIILTARINDYSLSAKSSPLLVLRDITIDPADEHESMHRLQKRMDDLQYIITTDLKDQRYGKVENNIVSEKGVHLIKDFEIKFIPEAIDIHEYQRKRQVDAGVTSEINGDIEVFTAPDGRTLADIKEDDILRFKHTGFGGDLAMDVDKTTTVLGKFIEIETNPDLGTRYFLGSQTTDTKVPGFPDGSFARGEGKDPNPDGMSFLDIAEKDYMEIMDKNIELQRNSPENKGKTEEEIEKIGTDFGNDEFWDKYNAPFLEDAFIRGDNIRLVSDTIKYNTGTYVKEIDTISGDSKNIGLAQKYNYIYHSTTKTYIKQ